jgi:hypothetical protein
VGKIKEPLADAAALFATAPHSVDLPGQQNTKLDPVVKFNTAKALVRYGTAKPARNR